MPGPNSVEEGGPDKTKSSSPPACCFSSVAEMGMSCEQSKRHAIYVFYPSVGDANIQTCKSIG